MPTKVFIACPGLGHIARGYESFAQDCFDALSQAADLDVMLFKGGGAQSPREVALPVLSRNHWLAQKLGALIHKSPYTIENTTFFLNLLPHLYKERPDVIYFSDVVLGHLLWHWRKLTRLDYKLLFSNGAPLPPPFSRWDYTQQLVPATFEVALKAGEPAQKMTILPCGLHMPTKYAPLNTAERKALRKQLGLPEDQALILSVGAVNKYHKRVDYLIREVANLPEPRPYLVVLGQIETESSEIIELGKQLLGKDRFQVGTVPQKEVSNYYRVADIFVLASLGEAFGRVYLEAMSYGLPCIAHDNEATRFILGQEAYLTDLSVPTNLSTQIQKTLTELQDPSKAQRRHHSVYERFSWETLRPSYVQMIHQCVNT